MIRCESCGFQNTFGNICSNCGASLVDNATETGSSRLRINMSKPTTAEPRKATSTSSTVTASSSSPRLKGSMISPSNSIAEENKSSISNTIVFKRSPRLRHEYNYETIKLPLPPRLSEKPEVNWVTTLLPTFATVFGAVMMALLMKNTMMLIYSLPMTAAGVIVSVLNHRGQIKKFESEQAKQKEFFDKSLSDCITRIESSQKEQREVMEHTNPSPLECIEIVEHRSARLWERSWIDEDFLSVRLGTGDVESCVSIVSDSSNISESTYDEKIKKVPIQYQKVKSAPVICDIRATSIYGVVGTRSDVLTLIQNTVIQLCTLDCYSELKLVFLLDNSDTSLIWANNLPHVIKNSSGKAYYITTEEQAAELYKEFVLIFEQRKQDSSKMMPYYLFIVMNPDLIRNKSCPLYEYLFKSSISGVGTIIYGRNDATLPQECRNIIYVNGTKGEIVNNGIVSLKRQFIIDSVGGANAAHFGDIIKNIVFDDSTKAFVLPNKVTIFETLGINRIEDLDISKLWHSSDPTNSLSAPIGMAINGEPFYLNLHEKGTGPHAMLAGTTGAGKSEFMITYILSMALHYHPSEVAFVLIDYKGGGMAAAFDDPKRKIHLPHIAGCITNLDGTMIERSITSIRSEINRREAILQSATALSSKAGMDIIEYQRLYREHKVSEPLPHLFIIVDEFAQMKSEYPDSIKKLVSLSQLGRGLGMHLFLTTQKLGGVVDAQIQSNVTTRICMMVESASDSKEVIQRSDAASIKDKGRFYLKAGSIFELGQAAWSSAPYTPMKESKPVLRIKNGKSSSSSTIADDTQFMALMRSLQKTAIEEHTFVREIWKDSLPTLLDAESRNNSYKLSLSEVDIGVIDDPENQEQYDYVLDINQLHNLMVFGEVGTGKSTFLLTLLTSLCRKLSPEQLNFYVMDYSSRLFGMFKNLPHCGAVLGEDDTSKINLFFELIVGLVAERKKRFTDLEVDDYLSANKISPLPVVLVFIDNLAGLTATKEGDAWSYKLVNLLKECPKYGVHFIVACSSVADVGSKIKQCFRDRICFKLNDKYQYYDGLGYSGTVERLPKSIPGRGYCIYDDRLLEFQLAMYYPYDSQTDRIQKLKEQIKLFQNDAGNQTAKRLPVYSVDVPYEEFAAQFSLGRIPLGISSAQSKPVALPLKQFSMLSLYFGNPDGKIPILSNYLYCANREKMSVWIVKAKYHSAFNLSTDNGIQRSLYESAKLIEPIPDQINQLWRSLTEELSARKAVFMDYCKESGINPSENDVKKSTYAFMSQNTKPLLILFESYADFCSVADQYATMVFGQIYDVAAKLNVYLIGSFMPEDFQKNIQSILWGSFNPEGNYLLYGGQYNKQQLYVVPQNEEFVKILPYNFCLMSYKEELHALTMPCGEISVKEENIDDLPIF